MRRQTILAAVSALALFSAVPALAQSADAPPVATLDVGSEVQGALTADDAVGVEDDYRYDVYRFRATAGQRLEFTLRAEAFDAYLAVYEDGLDEALATDDDGLGDGTDARLRFTAPKDGDYLLHARTLSGLEGGDYTLSLTERPPAGPVPRPGGIRLDRPVNGTLADSDPETDDGARFDHYTFRARAGDRLAIGLASEAFDPVVSVGRLDRDRAWTELARNDDGPGGGLNSSLVFAAPEAGDYVIRARSFAPGQSGAYAMTIEPRE